MRIYRESYTNKSGEVKKAQKWYIDFRDNLNRRHKLAGFKSKRPTEELAKNIEGLVSSKLSNSGLTSEQQNWIEGLPDNLLNKLIKWGLLDSQRAEGNKLLAIHLQDWKNSILVNGRTKQHANLQYDRVSKVFSKAGFVYFSDVSASKLQLKISKLKRTVKVKNSKGKIIDKDLSAASQTTKNYYLKACKQFLKWAVEDQRISQNPIQHLKTAKAESKKRAALEPDELRQLLACTVTTQASFGLTGYQRAMLYRFATETGFRASEIKALKVKDFDFKNNTVTLDGQFTKNDKEACLPLRASTAEMLKELFSDKLTLTQAFKMPCLSNMAKMLRKDIKAAGIEIESQRGLVDFHGLRHAFGTMLAASGTHPKTAQQLMRHGDINLTMNRYTHVLRGQERQAIAALPDLDLLPESMQKKKTGTNDINIDAVALKSSAFYSDKSANSDTLGQTNLDDRPMVEGNGKTALFSPQIAFSGQNLTNKHTTPGRTRTSNLRIRSLGRLVITGAMKDGASMLNITKYQMPSDQKIILNFYNHHCRKNIHLFNQAVMVYKVFILPLCQKVWLIYY